MKKTPTRFKSTSKKIAKPKNTGAKTVDDYLAGVSQPARATLEIVRAAIRSVVPAETSEVISYKIPAFKYKQVLVWYAAFSDHCSFFPTAAIIEQFKDELRPFQKSKGTIQFPIDKPLPATLVKKIVKARLGEVDAKKRQ
ncbi:MAG: iron chaperone [Terriglobales bacterium]